MNKLIFWFKYVIYRPLLKQFRVFESAAFLLKYRFLPFLRGNGECSKKAPTWKLDCNMCSQIKKVAVICDDMTWKSIQGFCEFIYLTPNNWYDLLETNRPELFFCESTWVGVDGSWANRIHWNRRLLIDNRSALLKILAYCKKAKIPTVFWNKEDPVYFDDIVNGFSDTALRFDNIFTTAEECVPKYLEFGHKSVHAMLFGFSSKIFSPLEREGGENTAVFHGGWYNDLPQRCDAMRLVFDEVLAQGLELVIYDRHYGTDNENNFYPVEYQDFIRPSIPYECLKDTLKHAKYVININSVTDSRTMFSRRVFEMLACGRIIISNYSVGMARLFGERIWFVGMPFDRTREDEYIKANVADVFEHHTIHNRLEDMLAVLGLKILDKAKREAIE